MSEDQCSTFLAFCLFRGERGHDQTENRIAKEVETLVATETRLRNASCRIWRVFDLCYFPRKQRVS